MHFNKKIMVITVMMVIVSLFIGACGGGRPGWYLNPPDDDDRIYGTGASERTQSQTLGKGTADANARTDLANTIQVSVQSMVRTFLQQSGTMDNARTLQFSEVVSKNVVNVTLVGVRIVERDERDGVFYSLAEVSMDTMKNALLSAVTDAAAEFSELKAKQAFNDLSAEINKGNIPIIKE